MKQPIGVVLALAEVARNRQVLLWTWTWPFLPSDCTTTYLHILIFLLLSICKSQIDRTRE